MFLIITYLKFWNTTDYFWKIFNKIKRLRFNKLYIYQWKLIKKKISIAKAKQVISQRKNNDDEIPELDNENLKDFLNNKVKEDKHEEKNKKINEEIKNCVELYLKEYINNFDETFKKFYFLTKENYKIKYNVLKKNKDVINLVCADKNCKIKAKINIINNDILAFPDENGNIICDNSNNSKFISENHLIPLNMHNSYIKDFIFKNFANIIKTDIFNKSSNNEYLIQYSKEYFIRNPDISTDTALTILSKKFNTNYEEEINDLYKSIKIGKQYMYDHKNLLHNYITNLESILDNQNKKICFPYLYKLKNNKKKILWLIYKEYMKKNISNYEFDNKLAISQYFMDITYNCVPKSKFTDHT